MVLLLHPSKVDVYVGRDKFAITNYFRACGFYLSAFCNNTHTNSHLLLPLCVLLFGITIIDSRSSLLFVEHFHLCVNSSK